MAGEWAYGDLVSIIYFIMKHFCDEVGNITDTGVAELLSLKQVTCSDQSRSCAVKPPETSLVGSFVLTCHLLATYLLDRN